MLRRSNRTNMRNWQLGAKAPNANLSAQPAGKGGSTATLAQPQNDPTRTAVLPVPNQRQLHPPATNINQGNDEGEYEDEYEDEDKDKDEDTGDFKPTLPPLVS